MKLSLVFPLVLALLPSGSRPESSEPGETLDLWRTFDSNSELELTEFRVTMGGVEVPPEYLPDMELTLTHSGHLVFVDTSSDGDLVRRFEEARLEGAQSFFLPPSTDEESEGHATSLLEGRRVRFGEGGEVAWVGEGAEDALLAGLDPDLDLVALFPGDAAEHKVGDTWEVDAAELHPLFFPSGDLAWEWKSTEGFQEPDATLAFPSGTLTVSLHSMDGGRAELEVSGTLEESTTSPGDLSKVPVVEGDATDVRTTTYSLQGTATFDVALGHLSALDLEAELVVETETSKDEGQPGPAYSSTLTLEGDWSLRVRNALR